MAAEIHLRLYEELNDFLPLNKRKQRFAYPLKNIRTVRQLLKGLSIPENEVELVLVNGVSADFSGRLHAEDFVSLYPVFESLDVKPLVRLRKQPLRRPRFISDPSTPSLSRYLRLLGFDVLDLDPVAAEQIAIRAENERRIVLTRDPSLAKVSELSRVYLLRAPTAKGQLLEVLSRFDLLSATPFSRLRSILAGSGDNENDE